MTLVSYLIVMTFEWLKPLNEFEKSVILIQLVRSLNEQPYAEQILYAQTNNLLDIRSVHNRLELDYYVLPNRKEFLPFLDYFSIQNDHFFKPYNRIFINNKPETFTLFKQQKFVTNYLNQIHHIEVCYYIMDLVLVNQEQVLLQQKVFVKNKW